MQRVLFVLGTLGSGGAERVVSSLANYMSKAGTAIKIIMIYGSTQVYELESAIDTYTVKSTGSRFFRFIMRVRDIKRCVKEYNPDCVISFMADVNMYTIMALKSSEYPLIVSERSDPSKDPKNLTKRRIRDYLYRYANGIVFQTEDAMAYFEGKLDKKTIVRIISNPIPDNLPVWNSCLKNGRIITACRLHPVKNLPMLIRAVVNVRNEGYDCILDIFGDGPERNKLEELIHSLKADKYVTLRGFSENIHKEIADSHIFVICSDFEGMSNSMIEALSIGVPVIATDCPVGGARMFIQNEVNGILIPVSELNALENAIKKLLDNEDLCNTISTNSMTIRDKLNIKSISQEWTELINIIKGNTNAH